MDELFFKIKIPCIGRVIMAEEIIKGWSTDKKYRVLSESGKEYLLRLFDAAKYDDAKESFCILRRLESLCIPISKALDWGYCGEGKYAYLAFEWVPGTDAEETLPRLDSDEQYRLGVESGKILRKMHMISAPDTYGLWENRYNEKIDRILDRYAACGTHQLGEEYFLRYIAENRHLLNGRAQTFQHGDYHIGNMIVTEGGGLSIIDFNRMSFGDPWEEFNRITWCAEKCEPFASGRIDGYFEGNAPDVFFRLMALYISVNQISSIPWALPFGDTEVCTMYRQAASVLQWYDNLFSYIPAWYKPA